MHSLSNAHGGTCDADQAKNTATSGCYNTSEHHREPKVFGEYSSRSCICHWIREPLSGGAVGGSPCSGEADSPLCGEYQQLGALERILRYVVGKSNWGHWISQKKGNHVMLIGFSDVDFAGDVDVRKSTTGVTFFLATTRSPSSR
jgi:hypothetical protein